VAREGEPAPPWQLAPETLAAATAPARAVHLEGRAYALVADPGAETLALRALVVPRAERGRGWGTRLLAALAREYPGRPWLVTPIVPEGLADRLLLGRGWTHHEIAQLEMVLPLR
jgi:GNAT superfamily N-acetyltransferase